MSEPTVICPKCKSEIKLTESLAAPIVESVRLDYQSRLAQKDADIAKREEALARAKEGFEAQIADRVRKERAAITAEESKKAHLAIGGELEQRSKELADLHLLLKQRDAKLAEAHKAQAELVRKERELEDAKREAELTVERKVQELLGAAREQTRKDADAQHALKVREKDEAIGSMQKELQRLRETAVDYAKKEGVLREKEQELIRRSEALEEQVQVKLRDERAKIASEEARKVRLALSTELDDKAKQLTDLQEVLKLRDSKLAEAQKAQAEFVKKERELEDARREVDLTVEKRVQQGLSSNLERAKKEAEDKLSLRILEKEQTISSMQKQIEELKRKSEQGSQQLQGEVQELQLEALLGAKFPRDTIEPVPKGEFGGDILHKILGPVGQACGSILWESKRTKHWSDTWLAKLREDQRAAKADVAVIVSQILPKGVETFELLEGIWVTHPRAAIPVATALRQTLVEVGLARQTAEGQQTKKDLVYQYLLGPRFRQRVQAIVEAFSTMKEDLEKERKAILRQWAKREEQIERVLQASVGMYGDLQGIAGKTLVEIEGLDYPALDAPKPES